MRLSYVRFCHARNYLFPIFQPHSLIYSVQLQWTGNLLQISVRIRAGYKPNLWCLKKATSSCCQDSSADLHFVTRSPKLLLRKLFYLRLMKSVLAYKGVSPKASGLMQGLMWVTQSHVPWSYSVAVPCQAYGAPCPAVSGYLRCHSSSHHPSEWHVPRAAAWNWEEWRPGWEEREKPGVFPSPRLKFHLECVCIYKKIKQRLPIAWCSE